MDKTCEVNPDLDRERQNARIDVERVSLILYGHLLQKKRTAGLLFIKAVSNECVLILQKYHHCFHINIAFDQICDLRFAVLQSLLCSYIVNVNITDALLHVCFKTDELVSRYCKDFPNYHLLTRTERYTEGVRKTALFVKLVRENSFDDDTSHHILR